MEMEMVSEEERGGGTIGIVELIQALDHASLMAKQFPSSSSNSSPQLLQIYSSLHSAHHHLSLFLSQSNHPPPPPQQPHLLPIPPLRENSVSSAVGAIDENDYTEPMQVGDEEEHDDNDDVNEIGKNSVDRVEEKMRECFIQNKRPKRPLSPAAAEQQQRSYQNDGPVGLEFDPHGTRLRSLDLIYQFHS